jgi:hypothetical protein
LALHTTNVQTTFERKQQTMAGFIFIWDAYDNVLIDILFDILREKEVPLYMTLVSYKGLPQGLVLSLFLFNIIGSCTDRFISSGCGFLQYADDLVVYMAHRLFNEAHGLVQTACTSLNVFFCSMGLTISASNSEVMLFTRKHEPILVRIGSYVLPQTTCFKYLSIFFEAGAAM